ncbi:sialidase family protein [Lysobacter panacisoli]|uniref:Exo-alpha-sialidase n=1 Tax=Lysobacter panacisoli TaxID=1255263 RepID=A0ABP9L1J7_9GAMM|nr:sialidase family protein [Lysobacter panacisoli]
MTPSRLLLPAVLLLCAACDRAPPVAVETPAAQERPTRIVAADWPLPASHDAAQPDLVRAPDGSLLLSWIEPQGEGHSLKFARFANSAWSDVREIARGDDWFVNWADTPHIAQTADGALWAHWLRKSASAKYAYDVVLARSGDGGATWSKPLPVNDDGTPTEHGFVSLWPAADDRIGVAWLDGRNSGGGHGGHEGHGGAMTMRTALFDAGLQRSEERELDAMTCDCCQTDIANTANGALLVYRDRTPEEIRDISAVRLQPGAQSKQVHADGWKMPACPVNGPAIASTGRDVLVGWYTAVGDMPAVKLARSDDAGDAFAAPLTLDSGPQVQGRIDVALDHAGAWAVWTREDANGQSLQFARFAPDLSRELQRGEVAKLHGRGRGTGFAKLVVDGDAYVVWTDVLDKRPQLRGARYAVSR